MGVITIFSLSHYHVKSVESTDYTWGERAYDVVFVVEVTLDDIFRFLDGRCFHNEQGAIHLLLSTRENGFRCESWSEDLCHVVRSSSASLNHRNSRYDDTYSRRRPRRGFQRGRDGPGGASIVVEKSPGSVLSGA
jgi:hypothetical protein